MADRPMAWRRRALTLLARPALALSLSAALLAALVVCSTPGGSAGPVTLVSENWTIQITPQSLEVTAQPPSGARVSISVPQEGLGPVTDLRQSSQEVTWGVEQSDLRVLFRLEGNTLHAHFRATQEGAFTWPVVVGDSPVRAFILPLFEGSYVPVDDAEWLQFLVSNGPISSTEGLSMPFWGLRWQGHTLTYILTNEFNNELAFEDRAGRIAMRFSHEFRKNWKVKEYGLTVLLGDDSPVEPARRYRAWLVERGQFVSLKEKAAQVPGVEKLIGAAHVWLWGDALITRYDVLNWKRLLGKLLQAGKSPAASPARRVWDLMTEESRAQVAEAAALEYPYRAIKDDVMNALSEVAARRDLYQESAWRGARLPEEARVLIKQGVSKLGEGKLLRLNCLLLEAAFPGEFLPSERWGNGVSLKMIDAFAENGLDRLWLGLDSWQAGFRHPQAIKKAEELGYLVAPYDSYHSIHAPDEPDTWETAQFDRDLYESGPVVRANGTKRPGFLRKGYMLSPIAARPYVEKRVAALMAGLPQPFNSWFIDCDAFGELFDDYSPLHPATQQDDMNARLARMAWIRDTYRLVIGSEGGSSYAAPVIHFAQGMLTPPIGWGDPDLRKDKNSPYFLGRAWPPDAPEAHVKQVPLKPLYRRFYYDPRFRLPLYQTVFHDSVVATHHWGSASLKFSDEVGTVELLELLYNVPPLYHMNLDEFEKHKSLILAHYGFFSPLHRELGMLAMTDFEWLTPDRMVQRTVFDDRVEMVANFSEKGFEYREIMVPGRSVLARWMDTGATRIYTPPGTAEGTR